jgi:hypothetical protein
MSPLSRFTVTLTVGRNLTLEVSARNAEAAVDIAEYLFQQYMHRAFDSEPEQIIDTQVTDSEEGQ